MTTIGPKEVTAATLLACCIEEVDTLICFLYCLTACTKRQLISNW